MKNVFSAEGTRNKGGLRTCSLKQNLKFMVSQMPFPTISEGELNK